MSANSFVVYRVINHVQNREAYTADDLAHELGMHQRTAQRHLRELWSLDLMYICSWDRNYKQPVPVYRWGNKPDVEKPRALTSVETSARYREKQRERRCAAASQAA